VKKVYTEEIMMFKNKRLQYAEKKADKLSESNDRLEKEIESLRDEKIKLHEKVEILKVEKKTSEEDIKHMMRKKEEMLELKFQKKELENEKKKNDEVAKVKDQYRDKLEVRLETEVTNIKEMYGQILERLPNVNVKMKGEV